MACIEAIDYPARRELDKAVIRQLTTGRWGEEHHGVLIGGMTGTGKSFLACALAHQVLPQGLPRPLSPGLAPLSRAHPGPRGRHQRPPPRQARAHGVLLIDDFALAPLQDQERRDLLEILDDRSGTRSTIITSQLPPTQDHDDIGEPTLADALCDRLLHNAHRIVRQGPSRRKEDTLDSEPIAQRRSAPIMMLRSERSRSSDLGVQHHRTAHQDRRSRVCPYLDIPQHGAFSAALTRRAAAGLPSVRRTSALLRTVAPMR